MNWMLPAPTSGNQQCRASHHCENDQSESQRIQLCNPMLAVNLGSGLWRRMVAPSRICTNLLAPENASRRENEVGDEQLSYKQNGNECLHARQVA
jgi:hypothetical protein